MSTKPAPVPVSREAQIADLTSVRRCSDAFQKLRGTVGGSVADFFDDCLDQPGPDDARRMWSRRMNDLGTMLGTCANLRGDGKLFAAMELKRALCDRKYILPGEMVPPENTTPFTVFMVGPDMTLAMHEFFQDWWTPFPEQSEYGVFLPDFWEQYQDEAFCIERYGAVLWPLFKDIDWDSALTEAPCDEFRMDPREIFRDVVQMFGDRIVGINTRRVGRRTMEFSPWGFPRGEIPKHYATLAGNSRQFSSMACVFGKAVRQAELLGAFSPADQERLATWELRLPTAMVGDRYVYTVCILPETDHARWTMERPQFVSGVAHGHFAMVTPIAWADRVFAGEDLPRLRLYQNSRIFR